MLCICRVCVSHVCCVVWCICCMFVVLCDVSVVCLLCVCCVVWCICYMFVVCLLCCVMYLLCICYVFVMFYFLQLFLSEGKFHEFGVPFANNFLDSLVLASAHCLSIHQSINSRIHSFTIHPLINSFIHYPSIHLSTNQGRRQKCWVHRHSGPLSHVSLVMGNQKKKSRL